MSIITWSYDPTLPTNKDIVRLLTGDIDITDVLATDEAINFALTYEAGLWNGAASVCENIAAYFARRVNVTTGVLNAQFQQQADNYHTLALRLRIRANHTDAIPQPYAGGQTWSDKLSYLTNDDLVPPFFTRTGDDVPGSGNTPGLIMDVAAGQALE